MSKRTVLIGLPVLALWAASSAGSIEVAAPGSPAPTTESPHGTCTPTPTSLCLLGSRFAVTMTVGAASATAVAVTADTGYFTHSNPAYVEIYLRLIDGCAINNRIWAFLGSLTDSAFTVTIEDSELGGVRIYNNPAGTRANILDTDALEACPAAAGQRRLALDVTSPTIALDDPGGAPPASPLARGAAVTGPACVPDGDTHCLAGRFTAEVQWEIQGGGSGAGMTIPLTSHSGGFYFFSSSVLDLVAKVVESCDFYEVHYSGLSNTMYTLTLTDTDTAAEKTYVNPHLMSSAVADLEAFPNPGFPCAIFADGFETGDTNGWSATTP